MPEILAADGRMDIDHQAAERLCNPRFFLCNNLPAAYGAMEMKADECALQSVAVEIRERNQPCCNRPAASPTNFGTALRAVEADAPSTRFAPGGPARCGAAVWRTPSTRGVPYVRWGRLSIFTARSVSALANKAWNGRDGCGNQAGLPGGVSLS